MGTPIGIGNLLLVIPSLSSGTGDLRGEKRKRDVMGLAILRGHIMEACIQN